MKKVIILLPFVLFSCEKYTFSESDGYEEQVVFHIEGDFLNDTRGTLSADGKEMTDLWVLDYVDGEHVRTIHQTNADDDFGVPAITLSHDVHTLYFIASRGLTPLIDTSAGTISWGTVRDTFFRSVSINVAGALPAQTVTLDRIVTRLRVVASDVVPSTCASVELTPAQWGRAFDYLSGSDIMVERPTLSITVPSSYVGTKGQLAMSFYSISDAEEWTTDVTVTPKNSDNEVIASSVITDAPFVANRTTVYTGSIFGSAPPINLTLADEWDSEQQYSF